VGSAQADLPEHGRVLAVRDCLRGQNDYFKQPDRRHSFVINPDGLPFWHLFEFPFVGGQACVVVCAGVTYQDNYLSLSVGGVGFGGWTKEGGVNTGTPNQTERRSVGVCGALDGGGCLQDTRMSNSTQMKPGVAYAEGIGGFAGINYNVLVINFGLGQNSFFGLHWTW
jgi:hypothetical protein